MVRRPARDIPLRRGLAQQGLPGPLGVPARRDRALRVHRPRPDGDDLLSGTGLRIAYSIALSIPIIGTWIAFLVFGGEFPSKIIIQRLFVTHVMIVPALLAALIGAHLAIIWRQKHTQFPGAGKRED